MVNTDFAKGTLDAEFHLPKGEMADDTAAGVVQPPVYPFPAMVEIAFERWRPTAELQQDPALLTALRGYLSNKATSVVLRGKVSPPLRDRQIQPSARDSRRTGT